MKCIDHECSYTKEPDYEFKWMNNLEFAIDNCYTKRMYIISPELDKPVIANADSTCLPHDLYCHKNNQIIVWNTDIIHQCEFYKVKEIRMEVFDNLMVADNFLLQIQDKIIACNMTILTSTEGIYLAKDDNSIQLKQLKSNNDSKTHLLLAELDSKFHLIYSTLMQNVNTINQQTCNLWKQFLTLNDNLNYKYFVLKEIHKETIGYKFQDQIVIPECEIINQITILNQSKACYEDIPIEFHNDKNNNTQNGYLINNNIIIRNTMVRNCDTNKQIDLSFFNISIILQGTNIIVTN